MKVVRGAGVTARRAPCCHDGEGNIGSHNREIAAIRKLVHTGMKMLVLIEDDLKELAAAQKETAKSLQALIDSIRGAGNGHSKRKVDLQ